MNLIELLEKEHSKAQCDKIVKYVGRNPKRFEELVNVFLNGPYRITQRSAWPLSNCVEQHPDLIKPHLKRILQFVKKPNVHDAVKRNTLRFLQFIEIPRSLQGLSVDVCFTFLLDTHEPIAIRVFAMTVLTNLSRVLPELKNELIPIIEDQLPFGSPGYISRGKRCLKELTRTN
ncbi:MAG: hypothetical protein AABY93_15580 [Bacteroidota bacterium]